MKRSAGLPFTAPVVWLRHNVAQFLSLALKDAVLLLQQSVAMDQGRVLLE